eukprot:873876-Pyramimonas_sp.AAC.1
MHSRRGIQHVNRWRQQSISAYVYSLSPSAIGARYGYILWMLHGRALSHQRLRMVNEGGSMCTRVARAPCHISAYHGRLVTSAPTRVLGLTCQGRNCVSGASDKLPMKAPKALFPAGGGGAEVLLVDADPEGAPPKPFTCARASV